MRYKYLKGSEKDFEGAPRWARQVVEYEFGDIGFVESLDYMCKYQPKTRQLTTRVSNPGLWKVVAERQPFTEPSWDGVGLPPAGCEFEYKNHTGWFSRATMDYCGIDFAIVHHSYRGDSWLRLAGTKFRPIRSEADKKRDAVIEFITGAIDSHGVDPLNSAKFIYDAISAGKIPGVKLED